MIAAAAECSSWAEWIGGGIMVSAFCAFMAVLVRSVR